MTSVLAAILAMAFGLVLTPAVIRLRGLRALPMPDRWHATATPTTGGIALFAAFILALQPAFLTGAVEPRYGALVLGVGAAFAIGLWDDAVVLRPRTKAALQALVACLAAAGGVRPDWMPWWAAVPVAAFVLVAAMNSVNLLDHIDGLAAGTAAIGAFALALLGGLVAGSGSPVVAAALAGSCCGYLPFNYRRRGPAKVFMGDSGSHLLGFGLGGLALMASPGGAGGVAAAVAAPILVLAVPVLDTALVMAVRFAEGRPISQGGRDHSSHRLVYSGLSEKRAVAVLLGLSTMFGGAAIAVVAIDDPLVAGVAIGVSFALLTAFGSRLAAVDEVRGGSVLPFRRAQSGERDVEAI